MAGYRVRQIASYTPMFDSGFCRHHLFSLIHDRQLLEFPSNQSFLLALMSPRIPSIWGSWHANCGIGRSVGTLMSMN